MTGVPAPAYGGDAFGLRISSPVAVQGLEPLATQRPLREVAIRIAEGPGALSRRGRGDILYRSDDRASPYLLIDRRPGGYGVWSRHLGRYLISDDGRQIRAAPPQRRWPWQLLFAQVLPITAAIRGLEVVHASAVAIRGGVTAIVAPSGCGKSTLAAALVRRGAQFVADDVVALEARQADILAHPGVGMTNVTTEALRRGVEHEYVIARTAKHHLAVRRVQQALPLRVLVLLDRVPSYVPASVEVVGTPDPFRLLGTTFVFVVREPARLTAQLDIHRMIAANVRTLHARLPWTQGTDAMADALEPHLS